MQNRLEMGREELVDEKGLQLNVSEGGEVMCRPVCFFRQSLLDLSYQSHSSACSICKCKVDSH